MSNPQIEAIERNIKAAKVQVEFGAALARLRSNKDFKKVVLDGYFEAEAIRLVHLKADANMQAPEMQKLIVMQIDAIGAFSAYLNTQLQLSAMAGKGIAEDEAEVEAMLAEELAVDEGAGK